MDVDCIKCRSNGQITTSRHASESDINRILDCLNDMLKFKIKFSIWSNQCGFHIYSNYNVSIFYHLYIRDALAVQIADMDSAVVEVPDTIPLPYSSKAYSDKIYKPLHTMSNSVLKSFHVCASIDNYDYYEMFSIKHVTPKQEEHLLLTVITSTATEYVIFYKRRYIKNKIPSFLNAISCTPSPIQSFPPDALKYVDLIIKMTVGFEENLLTESYTEVRYPSQLSKLKNLFSVADYHFSIYFNTFGTVFFGEEYQLFTDTGLNIDLLQKYIYHSAIQFKELNLQHYIVSLHKCVENELPFETIQEILQLLYEQQSEEYVQHIILNYNTFIRDVYPTDFNQIIRYMQLYVTKTITPFMHLTEVFNAILSNRLSITATQFNELIRTEDIFAVKDWTHRFLESALEICRKYQFIITYDSIVYYLETDSFVFSPLVKKLEFCSNWHVDTSKII